MCASMHPIMGITIQLLTLRCLEGHIITLNTA